MSNERPEPSPGDSDRVRTEAGAAEADAGAADAAADAGAADAGADAAGALRTDRAARAFSPLGVTPSVSIIIGGNSPAGADGAMHRSHASDSARPSIADSHVRCPMQPSPPRCRDR